MFYDSAGAYVTVAFWYRCTDTFLFDYIIVELVTKIPTWIRNYMHYKVWNETTYPFSNSTVAPLKFGNAWVISPHTLLSKWSFILIGMKVAPPP